jgi:hypothetical protein
MIERGLEATAALWPAIRQTFGRAHQAAHILGQQGRPGSEVRGPLGGLLGAMARRREAAGELAGAVDHFVKVSRSYWPGLFGC